MLGGNNSRFFRGCNTLYVGVDFFSEKSLKNHRIYIKYSKDGKKQVIFDDQEVKQKKCIQETLPIDYLSADIIQLLYGSPDYRRKELDRFLCIAEMKTFLITLFD